MKNRARASCAVLLAFMAMAAWAQAPDVERARKEGDVVWYTAMSTQDADALRRLFQETHPGITLTVLRQTGEKIRTRILSETQAKKFAWDVVSFNLLDMQALNSEGLLAQYRSRETASGFPPGAVDPEGRWAAIYQRQYVLGYNTHLVAPEQVPKDWSDLLTPSWQGKLALDESDVEWYGTMIEAMGRERGPEFMRALARQKPTFRRGHTLLMSLLIAGDFPLGVVFASEVEQAKRAGAPVDWVRTTNPVVTSASLMAISVKAPHPNAARVFADFLLSAQGQAEIQRHGRSPVRTDLAMGAMAVPSNPYYVSPRLAAQFSALEREYQDTFLKR